MPRSSPRKPIFLWSPRPLIEQAAEQPLEQFVQGRPEPLLVIRLNDFSSELAAGLQGQASTNPTRSRPRRAATISVAWSIPEQTEVSPPASLHPQPPPVGHRRGDFDLAPELLRSECFVTPIKKRSAEPPLGVVTIGRAPEHDIVLQHPSVSRYHAFFEFGGGLSLVDAGSRNHTLVNGVPLRGRIEIAPGDVVKFGAVRCSICTASGLWLAVQS